MDRSHLSQLRHLLRPLATRVANSLARAVVSLVDDSTKLQLLQVGALADETIEDVEHFQPYGFSSVPLEGAEVVLMFPNGDRAHAIAVAVSDRRYRPTGGQPGDVIVYGKEGAKVILKASGDVEIQPAPGHEVLVRDEGGTVDRLVTKGDFDSHTHIAGTLLDSVSGTVTGATGAPATAAVGTQRLRVQ